MYQVLRKMIPPPIHTHSLGTSPNRANANPDVIGRRRKSVGPMMLASASRSALVYMNGASVPVTPMNRMGRMSSTVGGTHSHMVSGMLSRRMKKFV